MKIALSQNEIIAAVHAYIVAQGVNLTGKSVDVTFTATRGDAGIVANVDIEDQKQVATNLGNGTTTSIHAGAGLIGSVTNASIVTSAAQTTAAEDVKESPFAETKAEENPAASSGNSLFGNTSAA